MKAYPAGFVAIFWWTLAVLFVTGLLLVPGVLQKFDLDVLSSTLFGPRLWWAAAHAVGAFCTLMVFGALMPLHIRHGLKRGRHLRSGVTLLVLISVLALTGWGIYYLSDERLSAWTSVVHLLVGIGAVSVLALHFVLAKKTQRQLHDNSRVTHFSCAAHSENFGGRHSRRRRKRA